MTTLTLSSTSIGMYSRCPAAYRMVYILDRRPVRSGSGLIAGTAIHAGITELVRGRDAAKQDAAIDAVLAETPIAASEKEYRSAGYIKDALAAFRPEYASMFAGWTIEECEQQGVVTLGEVEYHPAWSAGNQRASIQWEFRRDLVGIAPNGERWVVDWKSTSRDEDAQLKAYKNSGQFMGYVVAWNIEHPDKPVRGVQPVRIVMRKPSKTGVSFSIPHDDAVRFSDERLAEWRRHTLRKAREILERDPQDADAWPLAHTELGCCRHTYGCCEFIDVCCLNPSDRALKLSTDEFESASAAKQRDRAANGATEGEP